MPTTNKDLTIYFQRADGKEFKITIPDYKEGITDAEIKAGAQAIVDQGAFLPDGIWAGQGDRGREGRHHQNRRGH